MDMKTCARCSAAKPGDEFPVERKNKDGLHSWCRPCNREYQREWSRARFGHQPQARQDPDAPKRCPRCRVVKVADEFPWNRSRTGHRYAYCKPCKADAMRESNVRRRLDGRMKADNDRRRADKHGVTVQHLDDLLTAQGGCCAICGRSDRLVVDHDHATGEVRGWLCSACNVGIGLLRDDPAALLAAAQYLIRKIVPFPS